MHSDIKEDCKFCNEIHEQGLKSKPPKISNAGKTVLAVGASIAAVIYGVAIPFVLPGFRKICLPYVPATEQQIANILVCLRGRSGSVVDLGSGDGRILFTVMKSNLLGDNQMSISQAHGIELNSWLVWYSRFKAWRIKDVIERNKLSFYKKDIFKTNLALYDNIVVFGVESLMVELEHKLKTELTQKGLILACRFPMPNWKPIFVEGDGIDQVWVYSVESITETSV